MSKKIPVYLSQEDLELFRELMKHIGSDLPPKQQNLLDRVEDNLMTFEDYEYGIKELT